MEILLTVLTILLVVFLSFLRCSHYYQGPKGEQGEKGEKGEKGAQGNPGEPGISVTSSEPVSASRTAGEYLSYSSLWYHLVVVSRITLYIQLCAL